MKIAPAVPTTGDDSEESAPIAATKRSARPAGAKANSDDALFAAELARSSPGLQQKVIPLNLQGSRQEGDWLSSPVTWAIAGIATLVLFAGIGTYVMFRPASSADESLARAAISKVPVKRSENSEAAAAVVEVAAATTPDVSSAAKPSVPKPSGSATGTAGPKVKLPVADLIESVRDAVVHITVKDDEGEPFATGSGFVIGRFPDHKWKWVPSEKKEEEAKADDKKTKDGEEADEPQHEIEGDVWLVATNHHVVAGSSKVTVRMHNGKNYEALGMAAHDQKRDLVILVLDNAPDDLKVLPIADPKEARQGEEVVAIGHPIGFDFTVSTGIISAVRGTKDLPEEVAEWVDAPGDQQWIQTTAAISSGNSGGPLLTMYGEVIGVNTWVVKIGENLAFASHSKHLKEMLGKAYDPEGKNGVNMTLSRFSAAKPAEVAFKIGDRDEWLETEVREELTRAIERALAISWKPGSRGDYVNFQSAALMFTLAEIYRYKVPESAKTLESLRKKKWDFESEVGPINRYAILSLEEKQWPMFMLGKVSRVNKLNSRHFWLDLSGRGFMVAVTVPSTAEAPKLAVGDQLAVLGYRVGYADESPSLPRKVHNVLAGLIAPVKLPEPPEDTSLLAAYDLIKHDRYDQGCEECIRKFVNSFARALPMLGKTAVRWQRFDLNSRGRQFDAIRFSVPPGLHSDIVWAFNDPEEAVESWGILPVKNFFMPWEEHALRVKGVVPPGLTKEEAKSIVVQGLGGGLLVPGEDYFLWFTFKDAEPRRTILATRLVPVGSFDPKKNEHLEVAIREGYAFKPEVLAKATKALREMPTKPAVPEDPKSTQVPAVTVGGSAEKSPGEQNRDGKRPVEE